MLRRGIFRGIKCSGGSEDVTCVACVEEKGHRSEILKERNSGRSLRLLDMIHTNVCGPMKVTSMGGFRYFIYFIDDYSTWVCIYPMKWKSETYSCSLKYERAAEMHTGSKVWVVRSDRGGEYRWDILTSHFDESDIHQQLTASSTPFKNGKAERYNRTIVELFQNILIQRKL